MTKLLAILLCLLMVFFSVFTLVSCDDKGPDDKNAQVDKDNNENENKNDDDDGSDGKTVSKLNGKTPEELYSLALEKVANLDNFRFDTTQVIEMEYDGQKMTMNQTVTSVKDGKNEYAKTTNDMSPETAMEVWYVDNVFYSIMAGTKFYANIPYEDYVENYMPEGATAEGSLMNIPESWFVDVKFNKVSSDKYYIEFTVSGEEYAEFMNNALVDMVDGIDNISYKVYFDGEGNLGDIITEFNMEISGIKAHTISTSKVSNIGTSKITAPATDNEWLDYTDKI